MPAVIYTSETTLDACLRMLQVLSIRLDDVEELVSVRKKVQDGKCINRVGNNPCFAYQTYTPQHRSEQLRLESLPDDVLFSIFEEVELPSNALFSFSFQCDLESLKAVRL
jgi:hypothetical protein